MKIMDKISLFTVTVLLVVSGMMNRGVPILAAQAVSNAESVGEEKQTISYIYHQHTGSREAEGGCYRTPVYHQHIGDAVVGGSCYTTPVYHSHTGDEISGGACYQTICYHVHQGDGTAEDGCYRASYHTHTEKCYHEVAYDEEGCYVVEFWDTDEDDYEGHDYMWYRMSCGELMHGTSPWHQHKVLNCNKADEITGYVLGCNKTESSIDGYAVSCEKTEETIDEYQLSCSKSSETIDGYRLSCGKEADSPCGKIIVSRQLTNHNNVIISVEAENMSAGELQFSETPFVWYDGQGVVIGTGRQITVSENGSYKVKADIVNADVNKKSLWTTVTVDDIRNFSASENNNAQGNKGDISDADENNAENTPIKTPLPIAVPTTTPTPTPTVAPGTAVKEKAERSKTNLTKKEAELQKRDNENTTQPELAEDEEVQIITATPELEKETQTVKLEEKMSNVEEVAVPEEIKKDSFLQSPAGKIMVITLGTFIAFTGIFLLFYLLRQSVSVYNDDGQGKMIYLGRAMVQLTDAGYLVVISEQMAEHSYTNRFCLKAGLFGIGRGKEEELLIEKNGKRISVPLQKKMTIVI